VGTTRENKYRTHEYTEGKYLISCMGSGSWQPWEMAEFDDGQEPKYDKQTLTDTGKDFPTLRNARKWCKENP